MEKTPTISVDPAVLSEADALAREIGLPVGEVVQQALEQGIAGMRSAQFFQLSRGRGDLSEALELLKRAGNGRQPDPGDELPPELRQSIQ